MSTHHTARYEVSLSDVCPTASAFNIGSSKANIYAVESGSTITMMMIRTIQNGMSTRASSRKVI